MSIVWTPVAPEKTRMWHFILFVRDKTGRAIADYAQLYQWSIDHPAKFWSLLADFFSLQFTTKAHSIVVNDSDMINTQWFLGARFNFAEQLLQRRDNHPAIISVNEMGTDSTLTYAQLYALVAQCAAGLKHAGVSQGDRVVAVMPNTANTIIAMLATLSIGAIWSSCSPEFGIAALLDRFSQINPSVLFISDGYKYAGKTFDNSEKIALLQTSFPELLALVITPVIGRSNFMAKSVFWDDFLRASNHCTFVQAPFSQPIYIMFSSGTTGKPKCIVHSAGGILLQHLKELGLHTNLSERDNLFFYTTCGWMMWNWMVSALALGSTLTLYEGAALYPHALQLFEIIDQHQVSVFGTSAKFISSIEKSSTHPCKHVRMSALKTILSTGSPLLPNNYDFVYQSIKSSVQLSSISGGTDILSCFALGNPLLPVHRGELQCIGLGLAVKIYDETGNSLPNQQGELVCDQAFPAMPVGFWNDPLKEEYRRSYFSKYPNTWAHGDYAQYTDHGGLIIHGRSDAVLNAGGVRIGTAEIYRQIEKIDCVQESVVIGQKWQDDSRIILFVKLKGTLNLDETIIHDIKKTLRENASPRHVPAKIIQVSAIPHTFNNKLVEIAVRQTVAGETVANIQSLANPEALEEFKNRPELES